jgi:hypothetical protein
MSQATLRAKFTKPSDQLALGNILGRCPGHEDEVADFLERIQAKYAIPWSALFQWAMADGLPLILGVFSGTVTLAQVEAAIAALVAIITPPAPVPVPPVPAP